MTRSPSITFGSALRELELTGLRIGDPPGPRLAELRIRYRPPDAAAPAARGGRSPRPGPAWRAGRGRPAPERTRGHGSHGRRRGAAAAAAPAGADLDPGCPARAEHAVRRAVRAVRGRAAPASRAARPSCSRSRGRASRAQPGSSRQAFMPKARCRSRSSASQPTLGQIAAGLTASARADLER